MSSEIVDSYESEQFLHILTHTNETAYKFKYIIESKNTKKREVLFVGKLAVREFHKSEDRVTEALSLPKKSIPKPLNKTVVIMFLILLLAIILDNN